MTTVELVPAGPDGQDGWYRSGVGVTVSAGDAGGSGVAETRCALDPDVVPVAFSDLPAGPCPASVGTDGAHRMHAASTDGAGNTEPPVSVSFKLDRTAPALHCQGTPSFVAGQAGASVSASVSDATSVPAADLVVAAAGTAGAGSHTVLVAAADRAGNQASAACPYTVTPAPISERRSPRRRSASRWCARARSC